MEIQENEKNIHIQLNKPSSLNALTSETIDSLFPMLSRSKGLIFSGAGRAFCAGSDVVRICKFPTQGPAYFRSLFTFLYCLSNKIEQTIGILDGITMGAGVGLSQGCKLRVSTDRSLWAMPETGIGFIPDVGATHFLPKLGPIGLYLSLTGGRLNGSDLFHMGISQYYVNSENIEALINSLMSSENYEETCASYVSEVPESDIMKHKTQIEAVFDPNRSLENILQTLRDIDSDWSRQTFNSLQNMCPLSLRLAHQSFVKGIGLSYDKCLKMEYDLSMQLVYHRNSNFVKAVTGKLINKSKETPEWEPPSLEEVIDTESYFLNAEGPHLTF